MNLKPSSSGDSTPGRTHQDADNSEAPFNRGRPVAIGAIISILIPVVLLETSLWRSGTVFTGENNIQIAEAESWWRGRLDLPERKWDTALKDGRIYSHFPPLFSFISAAVVRWFDGVPHWLIVVALFLPLPLLAYGLFLRLTGRPVDATVLSIAFTCGTSTWPVADKMLRGCGPYYVNQILGVLGLLMMLLGLLRRRGSVLGVAGFVVAALARQITIAYAPLLVWWALRDSIPGERVRRLVWPVIAMAVVVGAYGILNTLKFGSPVDSGYLYIYNERAEDALSRDAKTHGLFSLHYLPRNLYYMNVGPPRVYHLEDGIHIRPNRNEMGAGIWWTSPILLWLLVDIRAIWRDPRRKALLICAGLAAGALLLYHSTGYQQFGFNRYSLDYLPVLFVLIAPACFVRWRRWVSYAVIAWSVVYFRWMI